MGENISIKNANVNNLKNVSVEIPRGKLVVITGVSGSGKSSLAFDTLFAEGQRRFAQSLSSYARQFLGRMSKPDVESIEGVPPAIAIEQKVNIRNPRSTVATTTEIYDYLRLVYARIGRTYSPVSGEEVRCDSAQDVLSYLESLQGAPSLLLAPLDRGEDWVACLISLKERGYSRLFSEGRPLKIDQALQDGALAQDAMLLIDRFGDLSDRTRVLASISDAFQAGDGDVAVWSEGVIKRFCSRFERDGIRFPKPDEYLFSFNSPLGACPDCGGLGKIIGISEDLVIPDKSRSIYDGAVAGWRGDKMSWFRDHLVEQAERCGIDIFSPYCRLDEHSRTLLWEGEPVREGESPDSDPNRLIGINEFFRFVESQRYKIQYRYMLSRFSGRTTCPSCHGSRLRKEALWVKVGGRTIAQVLDLTVEDALEFVRSLQLSPAEREIVAEPLSEIESRLACIEDVGLGYLTLSRACNTLSGGESQRINLVTALGSSLVGSMYILDEPSIGLHSRDTARLIGVLRRLRDLGNTVVVVEHDEDIIRAADYLIDIGPEAGRLGGQVVYQGEVNALSHAPQSYTLKYLTGELKIPVPTSRRKSSSYIEVKGAAENNLKGVDVKFPLGVMTAVTGVSGSGKSTLVTGILYRALARHFGDSCDTPGTYASLEGDLQQLSGVEFVDQNPIGKSSRSNPATYIKAFDEIRKLFAEQQLSKQMGYKAGYFSFNAPGGRCEECKGEGKITIEMQFMADITLTCDACHGKRFSKSALDVTFRGKNIYDVLDMTVNQAIGFFSASNTFNEKKIVNRLKPLQDVGLGYIKLGQSSSTLSGGENQRVKLASFLSGDRKQHTMFIFDEPTTGLHMHDINTLMRSLDRLVQHGHTLVVIEHNLDVIKCADHVIDLGPEGGDKGGNVVATGTPEEIAACPESYTGQYLKAKLGI